MLARLALEKTPAAALRCESSTARFFENAFDVISEAGSNELEEEFRQLLHRFLRSRNLRYELSEPFRLQSHLPGIFSALFSDLVATSQQSPQLQQAMGDFESKLLATCRGQRGGQTDLRLLFRLSWDSPQCWDWRPNQGARSE